MTSTLSKIALAALGVLAYKNRDKISDMLGDLGDRVGVTPGSSGGIAGGSLGDLLDGFRQAGHGEVADSWVGTGPNKTLEPRQVEEAISPEMLDMLATQTGLSRDEILNRLSRDIPDTVDEMTPEGHLPDQPATPQAGKGVWR